MTDPRDQYPEHYLASMVRSTGQGDDMPSGGPNSMTITIRAPVDLYCSLMALADLSGLERSEVVRRLIQAGFGATHDLMSEEDRERLNDAFREHFRQYFDAPDIKRSNA